jgi:hypothetical protein
MGLLNVGMRIGLDGTFLVKCVALQIEDKATLDGKNERLNSGLDSLVLITQRCRLIMEEGSKITGYVAGNSAEGHAAVVLKMNSGNPVWFFMRGGEISGNTLYDDKGGVINISNTAKVCVNFHKTGGVFRNNKYGSTPQNYITWNERSKKITVTENDAETEIYFTTRDEFEAIATAQAAASN